MFGLFKRGISKKNSGKPFFENRNPAEQIDWFRSTRGWRELSPVLVEGIVEHFKMSPMFEVFVGSSMQTGLVAKYAELSRRIGSSSDTDIAMAAMSGWLQQAGNKAVQELAQHLSRSDELNAAIASSTAANAFDASLALDENQLGAYLGKAFLADVLDKPGERIAAAEQGLEKVAQLVDLRRAMAMSDLSLAEGFDQIAEALAELAVP